MAVLSGEHRSNGFEQNTFLNPAAAERDCEAGSQQTWGHATQNLPQFKLQVTDDGDIIADGVVELIYGRLSNVLTA